MTRIPQGSGKRSSVEQTLDKPMSLVSCAPTGPRVLDLFAGAGGFSLGFHWAGYQPGIALDHNATAVKTLEANFGRIGLKAFQRDLSTFTPANLRALANDSGLSDRFDVIVGGPPCQGWSKVGRGKIRSLQIRNGADVDTPDPRNALYRRFLGFVSEFAPPAAVMENVPGMLSHKSTNVASQVVEAFEACGYTVSLALINAADYGVPQVRERLFFVGIRKDLGVQFSFPKTKDHNGERLFPEVSTWAAIGDLPPIKNGSRLWARRYNQNRRRSPFAARMREHADANTINDHVCRSQNAQDLEAFKLMRQGDWYRDLPAHLRRYRDDIFEDKYKKLLQNRPSWCVTAHLSRDCYTHIHPTQARTISIREAARLQSFPDWFEFAGNMGDRFTLIGNAVAPMVAEKIAFELRRQVLSTL